MSDSGNQFHYFRLTADDRILWGGYDAIYYPGGRVGPLYDDREATYATLARNFAAMLPQLADAVLPVPLGWADRDDQPLHPGVRRRRWAAAVVYALGYTGLGVSTTCFAARVLADMLFEPTFGPARAGLRARAIRSRSRRSRLRTAVVSITRRAIARVRRPRRSARAVAAHAGPVRDRIRLVSGGR